MNRLPEEAGKLPWTEGSLLLMQNLQHEMERWRTEVNEGNSVCNKPDCYFCRLANPTPRPEIPEFIMSSMDKFNLSNSSITWSDNELNLMDRYKDKPISVLINIFPGRTPGAILDKRKRYRNNLGLSLLQRGGRI